MKKLTPSLKEFCQKQELLRLSYIDKGYPRVVPVWFVVIGKKYYVGTYGNSPKWKAIRRKPQIGWVIDGGKQNKYKGVSMYGVAEEVTDQKLRARIYRALGEKYYGSATHPKHIEVWGEVDDLSAVFMRLKSEDGFGWEY
ncbi:MAG TPA: pyridoxamine 5'-phosphate oxidase family protein [Blastocatellia bacterium]|jgi:Predicted flavin-nucleotide-binding protein|nr:pyridoxamine 5'-phosphate oxidase family protein [Blastocatellia bacterium]